MKRRSAKWIILLSILLTLSFWSASKWLSPQKKTTVNQVKPEETTPAPLLTISQKKDFPAIQYELETLFLNLPKIYQKLVITGQHILKFPNQSDYDAFLDGSHENATDWEILDQIDEIQYILARTRLNRVELPKDVIIDLNYIANIPNTPIGNLQATATPFRRKYNDWFSLSDIPSAKGAGIRIGIIDSGILRHKELTPPVKKFNFSAGQEISVSHGTQVASLILGIKGKQIGLAENAEVIDFQVLGLKGNANTFSIAKAMVQAAKEKCDLINLSLGTIIPSNILEEATIYANNSNALLVGASGNFGNDIPFYPAAYPEVLCVGAHDAKGEVTGFSSYGNHLDLIAPGFGLFSCGENNGYRLFTGTSAAAPIFTAAIARICSDFDVSPETAASWLLADTSDAGTAGFDQKYGEGILNLKKVYFSDQKNWVDPSIDCAYYEPATQEIIYKFTNSGTQTVWNIQVETTGPHGNKPLNIAQLPAGKDYLYKIPVNPNLISKDEINTIISAKITNYRTNNHLDLNEKNNELITATNRKGKQLVLKAYATSATEN